MTDSRIENTFIWGAVALVTLLTLVTIVSIFTPKTSAQMTTKEDSRMPASLITEDGSLPQDQVTHPIQQNVYQYDCPQKDQKLIQYPKEITQIRIEGHFCNLPEKSGKKAKIFNLSTNVEASVFDLGSSKFSTDLIHLVNGNNIIQIEEIAADGVKHVMNFTIVKNF